MSDMTEADSASVLIQRYNVAGDGYRYGTFMLVGVGGGRGRSGGVRSGSVWDRGRERDNEIFVVSAAARGQSRHRRTSRPARPDASAVDRVAGRAYTAGLHDGYW